MQVGLLGALDVREGDREIPIAGTKLRTLFAVLALHVGRVVPAEQLVDILWGQDPPAGVRNSMQGLISKLRRTLGSVDMVALRGSGYTLELPADDIDVHRFERLVAEGRAAATGGDLPRAVELLTAANALWRGDALSDFMYEDFAGPVIGRLAELRLAAVEERLALELQLDRPGVVVELEGLVAAHPLRERLRGLLMTALYRGGRQAEALRIYQEGRRVLGEELGLEPGPELRRLEAAILAQDSSLDALEPESRARMVRAEPRTTIPVSLTPLVGREAEVRELAQLAADHRLVTLVGPGGVGKTRLALEVARMECERRAQHGYVVELAPVGDPAGLAPAIAAVLDVPDPSRLVEMIGDREMLLVLDNCEHLIAAAAAAAEELLLGCPGVRLVATSREGLRVGGELVWPVPPLATGDAVALFVGRARAAGAKLADSAESGAAISDLCARLDGLPLAIELAAARARVFPVAQISARLHDRFRLLTGGSRTALPRQQTLRAVVDWSYDLLFEDEQRVLERLSVFPGGFDLGTAEAVCSDDSLAAPDIADHLLALVDKSLVHVVRHGDDLRFAQLQTLCHYGREKLAERGDAEQIRSAMAAHFSSLCAESAAAYIGDRQRAWLRAVDREHDNLRAALDWAIDNGDADTALTIAGGASWPHWLAGTVYEGKRWLDDAFACEGEASEPALALALTGRGLLDFLTGSPEHADADLEAALAIARARNDVPMTALALSFYAEIAAVRGEPVEARRRRLVVLARYGEAPEDPFDRAARAYSLGKLAVLDGDLVEAERQYRSAAKGFAMLDRPVMLSISLGMVADFDELAGSYASAATVLDEAIATNDSLGLRGFTGSLLTRLGWALLHEGELARAEATYERALDDARRLRNVQETYLGLAGMAVVHRLHGRNDDARAAATEALELFVARGHRRFRNRIHQERDLLVAAATCCTMLGVLAAEAGEAVRAARFLGHAERLRTDAGAPLPPFQHDDVGRAGDAAAAALGDAAFLVELEAGRRGELHLDGSRLA